MPVSTHVRTVLKPEARHTEQRAKNNNHPTQPGFQASLSFTHYNHSRHWRNSHAQVRGNGRAT